MRVSLWVGNSIWMVSYNTPSLSSYDLRTCGGFLTSYIYHQSTIHVRNTSSRFTHHHTSVANIVELECLIYVVMNLALGHT